MAFAPDGNIYLAGYTTDKKTGKRDAHLIAVSPKGKKKWDMSSGGSKNDSAKAITVDPMDGSILVAGITQPELSWLYDGYLFKVSAKGKKVWETRYGGQKLEGLEALALAGNGAVYLAGYTTSVGAGKNDMYLVHTHDPQK